MGRFPAHMECSRLVKGEGTKAVNGGRCAQNGRDAALYPRRRLIMTGPSAITTNSGHSAQSRNTSPGRRGESPADANPETGAEAPTDGRPGAGDPGPPTPVPTPGAAPPGERSAVSRFCASARNTPVGNCHRYASKSAGFVLFIIGLPEQILLLRGCRGRSGRLTRRCRLLPRGNRGRPDGSRLFGGATPLRPFYEGNQPSRRLSPHAFPHFQVRSAGFLV